MDEPLLTPAEVAELFGVRAETVSRWAGAHGSAAVDTHTWWAPPIPGCGRAVAAGPAGHDGEGEVDMTTYAQRALDEVTEELERVDPRGNPYILRVLYALLVLTKGTDTSMEDVHDVWSLWRTRSTPEHPSLVPFDELGPEVRELDRPYMEAVHRAAIALGLCRHEWDRTADDESFPLACLHCGLRGRLVEVSDVG